MRLRLLVVFAVVLSVVSPQGSAAEVPTSPAVGIKAPFGLKWDESAERIEKLLTNARAEIVDRKAEQGAEVLYVKMLTPGVEQARFTFRERKLKGVALRYERPEWTPGEYAKFYEQVATRITKQHGAPEETLPPAGEAVAPREQRWKDEHASLELKMFEAPPKGRETMGRLRIEVTYAIP